jgi:competence protein ComEA
MINRAINNRTSGFLILLLTLLILYFIESALSRSRPRPSPCNEYLFVQIEGDIVIPGVYAFCNPVNLIDLIEKAGGLTRNTPPPESFKTGMFFSDTRVTVQYNKGEWKLSHMEMSAFYKLTLGLPISLNRESEEGLTALPGIGPELAKSIVRERSERGGFNNLREIMTVDGIGDRSFRKIRRYLKL